MNDFLHSGPRADDLELETRLVHAGTLRSDFGETSEALFLTAGACLRERRAMRGALQGRGSGLHLLALLEPDRRHVRGAHGGARRRRGGARHRDRHGGGDGLAPGPAPAPAITSSRRAQLFGSCRYVCEELLPRFGIASTLVDGTRLDAWRAAVRPETKAFFLESPTNPTLDLVDIAGVAEIAHAARANARRRQCLRDAALAEPAEARRRLRRLFGDEAYRRAGALPWRRDPRLEASSSRRASTAICARPARRCRPFNAWVLLKGLETLTLRVGRQTETAAAVADSLAATRT